MKEHSKPTPEGIALYRRLQSESPPAWIRTEEDHQRWVKDLVRREAEALGVPEHVIEAEHKAAIRENEAYWEEVWRKEKEFLAANPDIMYFHDALRSLNAPRESDRPIPTWDPEDDKG
jgi:hypothetical protein